MEEKTKEQLAKFLQTAKKKTFASVIAIPKFNRDKSKEYTYQEGSWKYRDRYYGSEVDTGQELVFHNKRLIWSMSYRGGMLDSKNSLSKKCFSFLKKCLRNAPIEFPIRGPLIFKEGNFRYENSWQGSLEDFVGEEKIFLNGEQIYFRNYLGGSGEPRSLR